MTTLRQINANRANAQNSTGPKSDEGKHASRANALKHGLAGEGIVLPDEEREAAAERAAQWCSSIRPMETFDLWLLESMAVDSIRVERCRVMEAVARERLARRAGESWDDDQRLAAERLAAGLARRPEVVARQLAQTAQGVELLVERWEALGAHDDWDDARRTLALDLLGVPRALRDGPTRLDPPDGDDPETWLARLVSEQVAGLQTRKPALDEQDGRDQASAMLGLGPADAELNRLRRYEATCMRRLERASALIRTRSRSPMSTSSPARTYAPPAPLPPPEIGPGHRLSDAMSAAPHDRREPSPVPAPSPRVPTPKTSSPRRRPSRDAAPRLC